MVRWASLLCVLFVVTGCGSSKPASNGEAKKAPSQVVADALAAAKSATSVHLVGSGSSGGSKLILDLDLLTGKGGKGTVTSSGLTFTIIRTGTTAYFKGGTAFWTSVGGATAATVLKGKWLSAPANTGELAPFTQLTDLDTILTSIVSSKGSFKFGPETTIDGQSALAVEDAGGGGTLYVASTGTPYPLELKGKGTATIRFEDWNEPVTLTAPKGAISLASLEK